MTLTQFDMPSLAGAIFDNQQRQRFFEDIITFALIEFFERSEAWFKRFDYYDSSIEFWAKQGSELTEYDQEILGIFGFDHCWVCWHDGNLEQPLQVGEKAYYVRRNNPPTHRDFY